MDMNALLSLTDHLDRPVVTIDRPYASLSKGKKLFVLQSLSDWVEREKEKEGFVSLELFDESSGVSGNDLLRGALR